ncbi:Mitochondrial tRNAs modification protein [Xanthoria parietina]
MLKGLWRAQSLTSKYAYHRPVPVVRQLITLAIETSCDDTSVAVLETARQDGSSQDQKAAILHFHEKVTADNARFRGVHPIVALESHNKQLAPLVAKALRNCPSPDQRSPSISIRAQSGWLEKTKPDFISVTRGPGMLSSLNTGLNTAKGLATAWQVPLVGVNHMQAHALTPRLVHALETENNEQLPPKFPFLTLLVSGGHTMLVHSKALTHHAILANTMDIAIGDCIDKMARHILPAGLIEDSAEMMYGRLLEHFAFPNGPSDHGYIAPRTRAEDLSQKPSIWGWALTAPLSRTRSGSRSKDMAFSFAGLGSAIERICHRIEKAMTLDERRDVAREAFRVAFEHLASRVLMALQQLKIAETADTEEMGTLVVSGGVASNRFLRTVLRSFLDIRGFAHIRLVFPPTSLCTDNAAMIAWTGTEMYKAGYETDLSCGALRKWSIDPSAESGGILGVDGWRMK